MIRRISLFGVDRECTSLIQFKFVSFQPTEYVVCLQNKTLIGRDKEVTMPLHFPRPLYYDLPDYRPSSIPCPPLPSSKHFPFSPESGIATCCSAPIIQCVRCFRFP